MVEARLQVMDEGSLQQPIPLALQGSTVQSCTDSWERQHSIHALIDSGGMVLSYMKSVFCFIGLRFMGLSLFSTDVFLFELPQLVL